MMATNPHSLKFRPKYLPPAQSSYTEQAEDYANLAMMQGKGLYHGQDTFARCYILAALEKTQSVPESAALLKVSVKILRLWMKHLHIHPGQLILDFPEAQPRKHPQKVNGLARVLKREAK